MSHQIEVNDIVGGVKVIDLAGQYGDGIHKKIEVEVTITTSGEIFGEYVVRSDREPVYRGNDPAQAVEVYNNL